MAKQLPEIDEGTYAHTRCDRDKTIEIIRNMADRIDDGDIQLVWEPYWTYLPGSRRRLVIEWFDGRRSASKFYDGDLC